MHLKREFTATVFILHQNQVLLLFHKKLQKWLPPGGHLEPNELPPEAAIREAFEETGLHIDLLSQENLWIQEKWNGKSFERPYMCLLEHIPERVNEPAHQHIDFIYVGKPKEKVELNTQETHNLQWFSLEEVSALTTDVDIFEETQKAIAKILADFA